MTGELTDGTPFEGSDDIRVIAQCPKKKSTLFRNLISVKHIFKTGDTFGTTVNSANIISLLLVLFLI